MAGEEHLPVVIARDQSVEIGPISTIGGPRRGNGLNVNRRLRRDLHLRMAAGDVEVMDRVSHEIVVLHDVGSGVDVESEVKAALISVAARLEANLHDALADCGLVAEGRGVTDGVDHWIIESLSD